MRWGKLRFDVHRAYLGSRVQDISRQLRRTGVTLYAWARETDVRYWGAGGFHYDTYEKQRLTQKHCRGSGGAGKCGIPKRVQTRSIQNPEDTNEKAQPGAMLEIRRAPESAPDQYKNIPQSLDGSFLGVQISSILDRVPAIFRWIRTQFKSAFYSRLCALYVSIQTSRNPCVRCFSLIPSQTVPHDPWSVNTLVFSGVESHRQSYVALHQLHCSQCSELQASALQISVMMCYDRKTR